MLKFDTHDKNLSNPFIYLVVNSGDRFFLSNVRNLPFDLSRVNVQYLTILKHSFYKG
ncbi:hypothetical protein VPR01S_07_00060 [Vibrio proteolyticus NBRC 13287]|uniref:Uncharacterized protein n=1 Tax=Vibrio proteolyticus NBRC 13287 TaxID=1219065 RepID=U3A1I2_VIBPR|nr:hypothetical protein VPR01S_07_00060 [Vibrio proteolyticus NBRC 13287]